MTCVIQDCNNKPARMEMCQRHYREDRLRRKGLGIKVKPGPRQDPSKPHSKYRPRTKHLATDTHCANGHEFAFAGFYLKKNGTKQCKICRRASQRKFQGLSPVPDHVPVSPRNSEKTHCPKGHEYAGDNLYIHPKTGARRCLTCHTANTREWRLKNLYDLTAEAYDAMLETQGNSCDICAKSFEDFQPVVDHDHETGAVRAVLCTNCNTGLGQFFDDPEILKKAIDYLAKFSKTTI